MRKTIFRKILTCPIPEGWEPMFPPKLFPAIRGPNPEVQLHRKERTEIFSSSLARSGSIRIARSPSARNQPISGIGVWIALIEMQLRLPA